MITDGFFMAVAREETVSFGSVTVTIGILSSLVKGFGCKRSRPTWVAELTGFNPCLLTAAM